MTMPHNRVIVAVEFLFHNHINVMLLNGTTHDHTKFHLGLKGFREQRINKCLQSNVYSCLLVNKKKGQNIKRKFMNEI